MPTPRRHPVPPDRPPPNDDRLARRPRHGRASFPPCLRRVPPCRPHALLRARRHRLLAQPTRGALDAKATHTDHGGRTTGGRRRSRARRCIVTGVRLPAFYHCIATNSFAEGDLAVQFLADFTQSAPGHFAITGGTGQYRGATGEVTFVDHPDPQRDDVTFRFTTR
jgi:hypothetical protein